MNKNPTCPKCGASEFSHQPVSMSKKGFWNPIICNACGTIVGQLPSSDEYDALDDIGKISNLEERLDDIVTLLRAFEAQFLKSAK